MRNSSTKHWPKFCSILVGLICITLTDLACQKSLAASFNPATVVRIEGPVQGTGTLVAQKGNTYTLVTAWHVLSSVRDGDELYAYTTTGKSFRIPVNSIERVGNVDVAIAKFKGPSGLIIAKVWIGDIKTGERGEVAGYPIASRKLMVNKGEILAKANVGVEEGYQLLYRIETHQGMSGGPIIDQFGNVVGIHGRGELNETLYDGTGPTMKTGVNYGVPIKYLLLHLLGKDATHNNEEPVTYDDYYAKTVRLWRSKKDRGGEYGIRLASKLINLTTDKSLLSWAYIFRRDMYQAVRQYKDALKDNAAAYSLAEDSNLRYLLIGSECLLYWNLKDTPSGIECWDRASSIRPTEPGPYSLRGHLWSSIKEWQKALNDFENALKNGSRNIDDLIAASRMSWFLGDYNQSIIYANKAISIDPVNIGAIIQRAVAFESKKNYPEVIKDLSRATQLLKPDDPRRYDVKFSLIRAQKNLVNP